MSGSISHTPGAADIRLDEAGDYEITVSDPNNDFTVYLNGAAIPNGNANVFIVSAAAGDNLNLVNTSGSEVTLTDTGLSNVSIVIKKLS